jgi:uncharacterized protein YecE (DUF72 family)
MAPGIHIGTSGWSYRHWRGVFYPDDLPSVDWLAYYAARFGTVEVNTSFYRTPSPETFRRWRGAVPAGFTFAVKANRHITHRKRLKDAGESVVRELASVAPLGETLGPVLFQLPPALRRDMPRLAGLLDALPVRGRFAVEFRHESWDHPDVYLLLARHDVAVCLHDWRRRPWPLKTVATGTSLVYARFHGALGDYTGRYDRRTLRTWAGRCERWRAEGRDVFCFFNNDALGNAVRDALTLRHLVGEDVRGDVEGAA